MSRYLSLLTLIGAAMFAVPAFGLENSQTGAPPTPALTQANDYQGAPQAGPPQDQAGEMSGPMSMGAPPANAQFMAWSDGHCVTLRYAVRSPGNVFFQKAVPQGFNPKILLVNYSTNPIGGPPRIHVGEVCFTDYGYTDIQIPGFNVTIHVLRCNDPQHYAQSMAYVQCGTVIVQTLNPGNTIARLQVVSFNPLVVRKIAGYCPCDAYHCGCHHHCYDPCDSHCHDHCHHHSCCLCVRDIAVCDYGQRSVTIIDQNNVSMPPLPILR